jgi:hypothetical protein
MKKLLVKILNGRKFLLKNGKSFKNSLKCYSLIQKFEEHLNCYPDISDEALTNYVRKHSDDILWLIPGNTTGNSIKNQLIKLL